MFTTRRGVMAAMMSLSLFACAHAGDSSSAMMTVSYTPPVTSGGMSMITGSELRSRSSTKSLIEAVSTLRPSFLRYRGVRPTVVIDGVTRSSLESLNDIALDAVERIQLLSGPDATIRYGTRHTGAVLLVTTRRK